MALRARPLVRIASPDAPTPSKELSVEEARKRCRVGSLELVVAELKEQDRLDEIAREHANTANRQGTVVKNAMKAYAIETEMDPNDQIQFGENGYRFDVTHTEKISVDKLWDLFQKRKITEKQFLASINVSKTEAEKAVGAHMVLSLIEIKDGKTLDIRKDKLETPVAEPTVQRVRQIVKPKLMEANTLPPPNLKLGSNKPIRMPMRKITFPIKR